MIRNVSILIVLAGLFVVGQSDAQIRQGAGGSPPSYDPAVQQELLPRGQVDRVTLPPVNVESLKREDSIERQQPEPVPPRFGYAQDVNLSIENSGTWETLSNGDKIWRLLVHSPGAKSLNFVFSAFELPEGAEVYVYSLSDSNWVLGAFTSAHNKPHGRYSTDVVVGDKAVVEYWVPDKIDGNERLKIGTVTHGYRDMTGFTGHGGSQGCNFDVNCPEGDDFCLEKKSVGLIIDPECGRWCSGSLLNNTENDFHPFFLTADHCLNPPPHCPEFDPNVWNVRFNYWDPDPANCPSGDDGDEPGYVPDENVEAFTSNGTTTLERDGTTDFALLELDVNEFPDEPGLYFNAWTRINDENNIPNNTTGIHHPQGDIMKISNDFNNPQIECWCPNYPDNCNNQNSNYWQSEFNEGTVEHGSSGSPLFNENNEVIGQLHGNCYFDGDYCEEPFGWYGRFDISWNLGLSIHLDPNNQNPQTVGGLYRCPVSRTYQNTSNLPELRVVSDQIIAGEDVGPGATGPVMVESTDEVTFRAGNEIVLNEGFIVEYGSAFVAEIIEECNVSNSECDQLPTEPQMIVIIENDETITIEPDLSRKNEAKLEVYPNPFNEEVTFYFSQLEIKASWSLKIMDVKGRLIKEKKGEDARKAIMINTDAFNEGIFFYKVNLQGKNFKGKIIKE